MKFNPDSWEYKRRVERMKKIRKFYCKECEKEYTLNEPCIHHCSDSPDGKARYAELRKKQLKSQEVTTNTSDQKDLYYQGVVYHYG